MSASLSSAATALRASLSSTCSWAALEQLVLEKKLRAIGVSNFNLEQMRQLVAIARVKPALLQANSGEQAAAVRQYARAAVCLTPDSCGPHILTHTARSHTATAAAAARLQTCCARTGSCRPSAGCTASSSRPTPLWAGSG